ncbi:MAG TPA: PPC domain-containing protein, partial [Longimicrobiaceae bacterium]|nr:PPC domain-containing protein [Longimicrobiaceae bacterium]
LASGQRFRLFRLDAQQGRVYHITLRSTDFDALLKVLRNTGPVTETLVENDDGAGQSNSLVRFTPPASGPYLAMVSAFGGDTAGGLGAFELEVRELVQHPLVARPIPVGDSVRGELGEQSATSPEGVPYDVYTFRAHRGQQLRLSLASDSATSTFFTVGHWRDGRFEPQSAEERHRLALGTARMSGDGRPTVLTIPEDGEYAVRVEAAGSSDQAGYTLRLSEPPVPRSAPRRAAIQAPGEVRDTLREDDAVYADKPYREWTYSAAAGERLTATMRSGSFDPYLSVGYMQADTFVEAGFNDDFDGRDSQVTTAAPVAREYVIRAMSLGSDVGAYTLGVETHAHREVPRRLQVGRIRPEQEVRGTLGPEDAVLELDGSPYDEWVYHAARAGERVVVTLGAPDFDAYVMLGRKRDGKFEEFTSNDDAQPATAPERRTDSRLVAVLPAAGEYVIRVNTFGPDGAGPYVLRVVRPR